MKYLLLYSLIAALYVSFNPVQEINDIRMNDDLSVYNNKLYLYTGEEAIYDEHPTLRQAIKDNIAKGLREGYYEGKTLHIIDGHPADIMQLSFYKNKLYKVSWRYQPPKKIAPIADSLISYFTRKYSKPIAADEVYYKLNTWTDDKTSIKTYQEGKEEFTVEFIDIQKNKEVEVLLKSD